MRNPDKVNQLRENGAKLSFFENIPQAREAARHHEKTTGSHFVSAYNDAHMIEGAGTLGLEVLQKLSTIDNLVLGVGGGGLIGGMALALKPFFPHLRIIGVQSEASPVLAEWFKAGQPCPVVTRPSFAEGVGAAVEVDSITWPLVQKFVDEFVVVTEDEICEALRFIVSKHKLYIEPSAAVSIAGILKLGQLKGETVTVLTGANVSLERFKSALNSGKL